MNPFNIDESIMAFSNLTDAQKDLLRQVLNGQIKYDDTPKKITPAQLRRKYPVLKDAYDQYRMVLKLVQQEEAEAE
jgi:hypothetical protein